MMNRFFLIFILFTGFASAEPYLVVRSATKLAPEQSLGTFVGSWDMVIMDVAEDGSGQILSQDQQIEQFGSLTAALAQARRNTVAMAATVNLQDQGEVARVLAEPLIAVSGLLTLEDAMAAQLQAIGLEEMRLILPFDGLLVLQKVYNPQINEAVAGYAYEQAQHPLFGLDSQVVSYSANGFSVAIPPLILKEVPMTVSPDRENTLVITLKDGDVVIRLRDDAAPNHVARIKELARDGFYDGLVFHRVIDGFMAQTGDPTGTGTSGSGKNLNAEFSDLPFERGTVGMARAQNPNSADSQFFIMFADGSFLNGNYTVIGQVISGMEFVDAIKRGEPPVDPDQMLKVKIQADL